MLFVLQAVRGIGHQPHLGSQQSLANFLRSPIWPPASSSRASLQDLLPSGGPPPSLQWTSGQPLPVCFSSVSEEFHILRLNVPDLLPPYVGIAHCCPLFPNYSQF